MGYVVIGIDPGTDCGWAVLDQDGNRLASGTWDISSGRHEGGGMRFVRCRQSIKSLLEAWSGYSILVAYEEVARHRGTAAAHVYGGIVAHLGAVCEEESIPYAGAPVKTVKKLATDNGNASKEMMMEAAGKRWGYTPADDNEADALWIAESLLVDLGFKQPWERQ